MLNPSRGGISLLDEETSIFDGTFLFVSQILLKIALCVDPIFEHTYRSIF